MLIIGFGRFGQMNYARNDATKCEANPACAKMGKT